MHVTERPASTIYLQQLHDGFLRCYLISLVGVFSVISLNITWAGIKQSETNEKWNGLYIFSRTTRHCSVQIPIYWEHHPDGWVGAASMWLSCLVALKIWKLNWNWWLGGILVLMSKACKGWGAYSQLVIRQPMLYQMNKKIIKLT